MASPQKWAKKRPTGEGDKPSDLNIDDSSSHKRVEQARYRPRAALAIDKPTRSITTPIPMTASQVATESKRKLTPAQIQAEQEKKVAEAKAEEERKQAEEAKRVEEEKAKKEAQAKATAEAEVREKEKRQREEKESLAKLGKQRYEEEMKAWNEMKQLRAANIRARTHRDPLKPGLDSSIKKCTAFVRKLKTISEFSTDSIIKELEGLNLTKYVTEAAASVVEAKLVRASDINKIVRVCSLMHQRHAEFMENVIPQLLKMFPKTSKKDAAATLNTEDDKAAATQKRATLRLLTELYLVCLYPDGMSIINILIDLMARDRVIADPTHMTVSLIVSFLRYGGEEFLGVSSRKQNEMFAAAGLKPIEKETLLTKEQRELSIKAFNKYYEIISTRLQDLYRSLRHREQKNSRLILMRGELPDDAKAELKDLSESYEQLQQQAALLSDLMDRDPIQLPDIKSDDTEDLMMTITMHTTDATTGESLLFDDEDTRAFYQDLPDLRLVVPPVLLGEGNAKEKARIRREMLAKQGAAAAADAEEEEDDHIDSKSSTTVADEEVEISMEQLEKQMNSQRHDDDEYENEEYEVSKEEMKKNAPLELLLSELPSAFNKEAVDAICEKFCYMNTKSNRQRLVQFMFNVHRSQLELLPYYSRLVATLNTYMKDIGTELVALLTRQFYGLLKRKDLSRLETKIKNIRFIAELTKFGVANDTLIFRCWHACMLTWSTQCVHVICAMLDVCGRWLYQNPATHVRCTKFLERMMALKDAKFMDKNLSLELENAFYQCRPPQRLAIVKSKERSILHQWVRRSLYVELIPSTVETILRRLRKLPWDPDCALMVLKCLANVGNVKYGSIASLASVASGLSKYHPIGVALVDAVLEEIRFGLETNYASQHQRRIAYIKYLGELYTYRMFDSQVIFDTLYLIITLGHQGMKQPGQIDMDPPNDTFRIRLICILLETCGHYFDRASSRKKLDNFLLYFQRYMFLKAMLPIDLEFAVADLWDRLRPKLKRARTLEEVQEAIDKLESDPSVRDLPMTVAQMQAAQAMERGSEHGSEVDDYGSDEEEEEEDDEEEKSATSAPATATKVSSTPTLAPVEGNEELYDDEDGEEEEEEDEEDVDEENDDDEDFSRTRGNPEDDAFAAEFDKMVADSLESRKYETKLPQQHALNSLAIDYLLSGDASAVTNVAKSGSSAKRGVVVKRDADDQEHVVFKLLTKPGRGTKMGSNVRDILIPADHDIAINTMQSEQHYRDEKADLKRLVIEGLARDEREAREAERLSNTPWSKQRDTSMDIEFKHRAPPSSANPAPDRDVRAKSKYPTTASGGHELDLSNLYEVNPDELKGWERSNDSRRRFAAKEKAPPNRRQRH